MPNAPSSIYLRLINAHQVQLESRTSFFGVAAPLTRQLLVDFARERGYQKRGGGAQQVKLDDAMVIGQPGDEDLAEALKVSPETVRRDCRLAKSWLLAHWGEFG
jgi:hypothetical protein